MDQPSDNIAEAFEQHSVAWPGAGHVYDVEITEDSYVELLSGRRRFWVIADDGVAGERAPRVGDLLAFYVAGKERWAIVLVITLLWEHDGILAGWQIASLRRVLLSPVE